MTRCAAAAAAVGADGFIEALEHGYDTQVGERGVQLSAGQRQLLAFARALVADPRILVLDEATSNVDVHTESLIEQGLRRLVAGRTAIVIAHRLSTIRHAGRIVVLEHGQIVEQGTHDELLDGPGPLLAAVPRLGRAGGGVRVTALSVTPVKGTRLQQRGSHRARARRRASATAASSSSTRATGWSTARSLGELQTVVARLHRRSAAADVPGRPSVTDAPVALGEPLSARFFSRQVEARRLDGPWAEALSEHVGQAGTDRGGRRGRSIAGRPGRRR